MTFGGRGQALPYRWYCSSSLVLKLHLFAFAPAGSPRHYRHCSQKFLVGAWLIMVVVLANSFASLLKSNQAVGNFMPAVDSIVDLAGRPKIRPVLPKNTTFEKYGKVRKHYIYLL